MGKKRKRRRSKNWFQRNVKYLLLGLVAVLAICTAAFALKPPAATTATPQTSQSLDRPDEPTVTTVAFLGDSYTFGSGATTEAAKWVNLVATERDWTATNYGSGGTGYGTAGTLESGAPYTDRVQAIIDSHPNIVVVSGGRNDIYLAPAEAETAIRATLGALQVGLPDARIIVTAPMWDNTVPPETFTAITATVAAVAAELGLEYADLGQPLFEHPEYMAADGVHPNDQGHAAIATSFLTAVATSP